MERRLRLGLKLGCGLGWELDLKMEGICAPRTSAPENIRPENMCPEIIRPGEYPPRRLSASREYVPPENMRPGEYVPPEIICLQLQNKSFK